MTLHFVQKTGAVIQINARSQAPPRESREVYGLTSRSLFAPGHHFANGIFNNRRQGAVRFGGEPLQLPQEVEVQSDRCSHMSKHIMDTSICQHIIRTAPAPWSPCSAW